MKKYIAFLLMSLTLISCQSPEKQTQVVEDFNFGWKFHYGDIEEAELLDFDDADWRDVKLPHDWSVEHSFTQENTGGATAWLPGGIGWYRKSFEVSKSSENKLTWIEFDGVYTNSEVWINGHYLGKRPFGYAPFSYDLSEYLKYGEVNVVAVKADRTAFLDSRWYPGSGIYRNVKLVSANKTHIPQWGTFVTTPQVSAKQALVNIQVTIKNAAENTIVRSKLMHNGLDKAVTETVLKLTVQSESVIDQRIKLDSPLLWDTENPNMYSLVSEVYVNEELVDEYSTLFGIREFKFDAEEGFFLNGKNMLIKGVCIHHDGGLVGAAVPKGVWKRRLQKLKDAGCNAIRTAHNPPSEEFLDLCDEMGFLVQDEAFDEFQNPKDKRKNYNQQSEDAETKGYTAHFDEWSKRDIQAMVLRDRNHPSIIMWSIGNEIEWTFPQYGNATGYWGSNKVGNVNYYWDEPPFSIEKIKKTFLAKNEKDACAQTAQNLSSWVKELDSSRPVTANLVIPSVSLISGYGDALDIIGLSYRQAVYDYCRRNYPDKVILGTENWARYHEWKPVVDNAYMSGIFMWTGIDYMGESRSWPVRGSGSGLLNFAGFDKPSYHMFKSLWNTEPHIYITTQIEKESPYKWDALKKQVVEKEEGWAAHQKWSWQNVNTHWNYKAGESIMVEVYTNQAAVELFVNNKSYGIQKLEDVTDYILKWNVPYNDGQIKAVAIDNKTEQIISTSSKAVKMSVVSDRKTLLADAYDVAHIEVQLLDENGSPVKHLESEVEFEITGPIKLLGVDNGSPRSVQKYQNNKVITYEGRCLLIVQSTNETGVSQITVKGEELRETKISIECK